MLKTTTNSGIQPRKIKNLLNRTNALKSFLPSNRIYNDEEWFVFISSCVDFVFSRGADAEKTDALTAYIYSYFKERNLFDEWFYENVEKFEENDLNYFYEYIHEVVNYLFMSNNYKYHGLFESTILEFNPLWNVDGVETTTRTLEQDGTVTVNETGTDTMKKTGTVGNITSDDYTKRNTGTDTLLQTGTDANAHSGTDTVAETGTDATGHTGTQRVDRDADNTDTRDEDNTDTVSKSPFNDNAFYNSDKTVSDIDIDERHVIDESDVTTFNDTTTETKNLQTQTTFNDTMTETKNLSDARTLNLSETNERDISNTTTHNTTDTDTKNLQNLTTRDLLDTERIILERHGNIGITTTTKLLTEFREYVEFNFLDKVAHDVVNAISYGVY